VSLKQLPYTQEQRDAVQQLYDSKQETRLDFSDKQKDDQAAARALLVSHGLDIEARKALESRWSVQSSWRSAGRYRVLVQCRCGYSGSARQEADDRKATQNNASPSKKKWARSAPYDFTGCLAHADVTYSGAGDKLVLRVVGVLEHNEGCKAANLKRTPAIPLHRHVAEVALRQLKDGASITAIQTRNIELYSKRHYRDQASSDPLAANYRYQLLGSDFRSLYRAHHRSQGIDIRRPPEINIDGWLDSSSSSFRPEFHRSIFLYEPRTAQNDRFMLGICTPEMEEAAWEYVHESQLLIDGTFGLSTSRLLVWIAMGVNAERKGVPAAMMLFSAPTGAKATHAGYDTAVITHLLSSWKNWLSGRPLARGRIFYPWVAISDTDSRERGAMLIVWSLIVLLLCLYHVRHCWTNKRRSLVENVKSEAGDDKTHVLNRIRTMEDALIASTDHEAAKALIEVQRTEFTRLTKVSASRGIAEAALKYLDYLWNTWMPVGLWQSWSQFGRIAAAHRLKIDVTLVLTTTNYLESFNGKLKRKEVASEQHSGKRLRCDVLSYHLVFQVLPRVFASLRLRVDLQDWKGKRFDKAAGGVALAPSRRSTAEEKGIPLAYYTPHPSRDVAAADILKSGRLVPVPSLRPYEVWASCATSAAILSNDRYPRYWLTVHASGAANCTCPDWLQRGGLCKHLRALLISTTLILSRTSTAPPGTTLYQPPSSIEVAIQIRERNLQWYGVRSDGALTPALNRSTYPRGYCEPGPPPSMMVASPAAPDSIILPPSELADSLPCLDTEAELTELAEPDETAGESWHSKQGPNVQSNVDAVHLQMQQMVQQEVEHLLPRLHGLARVVGDMSSLEMTDSLVEFHALIGQLT
ncbi:hypothetical protein FA95DRAFT_1472805, partial [Auriscalpium vulgare]